MRQFAAGNMTHCVVIQPVAKHQYCALSMRPAMLWELCVACANSSITMATPFLLFVGQDFDSISTAQQLCHFGPTASELVEYSIKSLQSSLTDCSRYHPKAVNLSTSLVATL